MYLHNVMDQLYLRKMFMSGLERITDWRIEMLKIRTQCKFLFPCCFVTSSIAQNVTKYCLKISNIRFQ